jgi:hypothetical protein
MLVKLDREAAVAPSGYLSLRDAEKAQNLCRPPSNLSRSAQNTVFHAKSPETVR